MLKNRVNELIETTIKRFEKIPTFKSRYRIAITGLSGSGKSVFLTSLINQFLSNRDMVLGDRRGWIAKLRKTTLPISNFPYRKYLERFREEDSKWPDSTKGVSGFLIEIELQSRYSFIENKIIELEFIDYPGEWLLDLPMQFKTFSEWSNYILSLSYFPEKELLAKEWLASIDSLDEKIIIQNYYNYLKALKEAGFSFIQPGHFLQKGELGEDELSFTPLPPDLKNSSLYKGFEKRYNKFIKKMLKAFDKPYFREYDKQIILVDLVKSLQKGYEAFEDMRRAVKEMLSPYSYGHNSFLSKLFLTRIEQVIIVGTKADNIANNQHNNYKQILEDMLKEIIKELEIKQVKVNSTIIASVKSTENVKTKFQGRELSCLKGIVEGESEPSIHYPGEIPEDFHNRESWREREFLFPNFKPKQFPLSDDRAVENIRMKELIELLIGEWL